MTNVTSILDGWRIKLTVEYKNGLEYRETAFCDDLSRSDSIHKALAALRAKHPKALFVYWDNCKQLDFVALDGKIDCGDGVYLSIP